MLHQIGVGALGPVFRTYEPIRDRLVAVKVFRLDLTPEQAAALADELERATKAGLFHPSIVEPIAAGLEGTVAYRAEEYVAAESLDVAMRHYAPASLDKALPFIAQLASAIDHARAAGVGHGALHPRDIFVTPDEARASGFGVVDALERLGLRAPVRRPYSPPERVAGESWNTTADVFSLGAIAFELLTGRRPSGTGEQMGALTGASLGDHSEGIRVVLARAMHENAAERYASAGAFASALADAAGMSSGIIAPQVSAREQESTRADADVPEPEALAALPAGDPQMKPDDEPQTPQPETLDDFAAETDSAQGSGDSPREAARKAIAARRRQHKPKPRLETPALDLEPSTLSIASTPPPATADEAPVSPEPAPVPPVEAGEERDREPASAVVLPASAAVLNDSTSSAIESPEEELATAEPLMAAADPRDAEPEPALIDEVTADVDAPAVGDPVEDTFRADAPSDRVIAVDDFRARESSSSGVAGGSGVAAKPERIWPRASAGRIDRHAELPPEPASIPPPAYDGLGDDFAPGHLADATHHRQPFTMLPIAITLMIGLLIGFGLGYALGNRDRGATTLAENQPAASGLSTPGTSGTSQAAGATDGGAPSSGNASAPVASGGAPAERKPVPPKEPSPRPTPKPVAAAPTAGTIVVTSTPSKAGVTIDGKWSGRTPLTLEKRRFGTYRIRVVEPGYEVASTTIRLSAGNPTATFGPTLKSKPAPKPPAAANSEPTATTGRVAASKRGETGPASGGGPSVKPAPKGAAKAGEIFVDSRPQGAKVIIGGSLRGVTPLRLPELPAGAYNVRLELTDHEPWTTTTTVVGGQTARVTGSMERIR